MSASRARRSAGGALIILAFAAAGCGRENFGDQAKALAPQQAGAVGRSYRALLSAEKCARRATDQQEVAIQLDRVSQIAARADAEGLGDLLMKTRAEWLHFDETADWVCGKGDPLAGLTTSVDAFDKSVVEAIGKS